MSNKHTYEQKHDLQSDQFEHIWVDIKIGKHLYTVNAWYRPPVVDNHDQFMTVSETIIFKLNTYKSDNKIIMSDFNFGNCYSKYPAVPDTPLDSLASDLFAGFGFIQLIDIPTRTNQNQDYLTIQGTLPKIADHDGTLVSFHLKRPKE